MKLWLLLAALAFGKGPDGAGDMPQSSGEIEGMPPGPPPEPSSVNLKARLVASRLRCPVCQGLSVADSTSETAVLKVQILNRQPILHINHSLCHPVN